MNNKRFIAFLLVFVMIFTVIGCKSSTPDTSEATPTLQAGQTPNPDGSTATQEPLSLLGTVTPKPKQMDRVTLDKTDTDAESILTPLLDDSKSKFDDIDSISQSGGWYAFASGTVEISKDGGVEDSGCIKYYNATEKTHSYSCPAVNLYKNIITEAGSYVITFEILLGGEEVDSITGSGFDTIIRGNGAMDANSFIVLAGTNYRYRPADTIDGDVGDWMQVELMLDVFESDFDGESHGWHLCLDTIGTEVTEIYIDNFQVYREEAQTAPETQKLVTEAETWVASEMTFIANTMVGDAANSRILDVIFTDGNQTMTVPGFWDGGNIWRVRFALPTEGIWTYKTVFSDPTDAGVHNITGSINVKKYSGDLDIYKHGFVTTKENTRYFVYADGTPFFYLGDTHWNFLAEEYDKAGSNAGNIKTVSHFKYIVNRRVAQGFTVYQTEPLNVPFDLSNGLSANDISGLRIADKYFKYIADMGLVHANAQFFFPDIMMSVMDNNPEYEQLLDVLARNWVARYGAYPVMWTLGQEVDNDFYIIENKKETTMNAVNNPWKKVCELMYKYDPHKNPISAHQEGAKTLMNNTSASNSAFRDTTGHTWWASQWKPILNQKFDFSAAMDYWVNGQGKPTVMYEGRYDMLWTNEYGARAQGWLSFLNGMCGHGYGAIDIWLYKSTYDMEFDTVRDGITITVEQKSTPWGVSVEFAAGYQMGYMKDFLEQFEWWNLVPTFGNQTMFASDTGTYSLASIGTDTYIAYFFDQIDKESTKLTGTIKCLDSSSSYTYYWFNPRTTAVSEKMNVTNNGGSFTIGERPSAEDWVLVIQKVK
jgi:hypothetical protein